MEKNNYCQQLQDIAEDAEIIYNESKDESSAILEELLKQKRLYDIENTKSNSTKKGCSIKAIKARRKKNKNKKTHRK